MPTRRDAMMLAGATLLPGALRAAVPCPDALAIDRACAPLLDLVPDAVVRAGLPASLGGGVAARRCDDWSPDGDAALALAAGAARAAIPAGCADAEAAAARAVLDRAASVDVRYGRPDPLAPAHRPYRVTAFAGPQVDVPLTMLLMQDTGSPAAIDAWQAKLDSLADTLLGCARGVRADEAAGCVPPAEAARATLGGMDTFAMTRAEDHPLVLALPDPAARGAAARTMEKRVQPAMALLRDTMAALTRAGRPEIGLWRQPRGDALYAANLAWATETRLAPEAAQTLARGEAARVAALLDRRLAARGFRTGPIAARIAAAFADRPGFLATNDPAALVRAAADRIEAAHAVLPKLVPATLAATPPPAVRGLAAVGAWTPPGSLYLPAGAWPGTVWIDDRSAYALPIPGVPPIAFQLGLPGRHLLAQAGAASGMPSLVRAAAWPAMTAGWGSYAERLAAEQGLLRTDPWADIARLADELLRAARLVVDVGIHAQRWDRARAEAEMTTLTGAAQGAAIDRIVALPGEAGAYTLGLHAILALRDAARSGRTIDLPGFDARMLAGGARPLPQG